MAGKKYSDIYKTSNTSSVANTDLFIVERADGNTYAFQANVLTATISADISSNRQVHLANAATFTANSIHSVILCDTVAAGANVTVTLPASAANGKFYTIKCIDTSGSIVIVTTSNTSTMEIEAATGGTVGTETSLTSLGEVYNWIAYDGVYRKI